MTTVVTGPGSANPIGGQMAAMKTAGTCIDKMIVKAPLAMKMALGENPKSVYHGKSQAPTTRMATAALIREELFKAKRYQKDLELSRKDPDVDPPEYDIKCESLIPVLKREMQVHFHAHRADDIFTAMRIGREFGLDYVVIHATDGHLIVNDLREGHVPVLSGPFLCDRAKPEMKNLTPKSPGILASGGVLTAIITDHPVIPIQYLPTCAALAVRGDEPRGCAARDHRKPRADLRDRRARRLHRARQGCGFHRVFGRPAPDDVQARHGVRSGKKGVWMTERRGKR